MSAPPFMLDILTDATGNLAAHLMTAILTQFKRDRFDLRMHRFVRSEARVDEVIETADPDPTLVFHALVDPELKRHVSTRCAARALPCFDLTGPLVDFIAEHTGEQPSNRRTHLHRFDDGYFERIQAMEFTAQHDDSRRLETLHEADIVLVGLSRVSKSPTATYLGSLGFKVANVSLAPEAAIPEALDRVRDRTVALTIQPKRLQEIRQQRFATFNRNIAKSGKPELPYGNLRSIVREVMWAKELYRERGYPVIDTTRLTVEQAAAHILEALHLKVKT